MGKEQFKAGFHGRWENKQFNASKTLDYARAALVIVTTFFTYLVSDIAYHPDLDKGFSQAIKAFEKLLRPLDKGYHLFVDRFYTSMSPVYYLEGQVF